MSKAPKPLTRPCRLAGGRLYWSDGTEGHERTQRKLLAAALRSLPDGPYEWTLAPFANTRSQRANRWLFGVVYKLMLLEMNGRVTEATKLELHDAMTYRHNPIEVADPFTGEVRRTGGPTHTMTIERFGQFIDDVMYDGSEKLGIIWPEPRESEEWRDGRKGRAA